MLLSYPVVLATLKLIVAPVATTRLPLKVRVPMLAPAASPGERVAPLLMKSFVVEPVPLIRPEPLRVAPEFTMTPPMPVCPTPPTPTCSTPPSTVVVPV